MSYVRATQARSDSSGHVVSGSCRAARTVVLFALSALLLSGCVVQERMNSTLIDRPFGEFVSDIGYSSISEWLDTLNGDEKALLELAYEADVEDGYSNSFEKWIGESVMAHRDADDDVVVILPDGSQFIARSASADTSSSSSEDRSNSSSAISDSRPNSSDSSDGNKTVANSNDGESTSPDNGSSTQVKSMGAILSVDSAEGQIGDIVDLPVKVENNPGILGLEFTVSYDDSALELLSADNGEAVKSVLHMTSSRDKSTGCKFVWDGLEISPDEVKDGSVLVMRFKVKPEAQAGFHSIVLRNETAFDNELEELVLTCEDGGVAVG